MEGSSFNKDVGNYVILSRYYDELLQDEEALSLWLSHIENEPFHEVLELASGSGVMAGILKKKGYEVIASDISKEMKEVSKDNFDGDYLILDMTDYELDKKFDLILCICDSINYLEENELENFFACANKHLKDNGRLIFDMHHQERLNEFKEQYIEEGYVGDVAYQWTIMADEYEDLINEHFTFYTKDGMLQENHTQHVFRPEIVLNEMNKYFVSQMIEDFVENEKILVIGRKK